MVEEPLEALTCPEYLPQSNTPTACPGFTHILLSPVCEWHWALRIIQSFHSSLEAHLWRALSWASSVKDNSDMKMTKAEVQTKEVHHQGSEADKQTKLKTNAVIPFSWGVLNQIEEKSLRFQLDLILNDYISGRTGLPAHNKVFVNLIRPRKTRVRV